jgi:hypothetical protein
MDQIKEGGETGVLLLKRRRKVHPYSRYPEVGGR